MVVRWPERRRLYLPGFMEATKQEFEVRGRVFIPRYARDFGLRDLPISARLASALESRGIRRLSDLQGRELAEFQHMANCGKRTLGELANLIERINAGEFQSATGGFSAATVSELLQMMDEGFRRLPARAREVLLLRLGADSRGIRTLEEIGQKFNLTRERVRQITERSLDQLRKTAGPKMNHLLSQVATRCIRKVCPLTPALLEKWLGGNSGPYELDFATYVRLLGELDSTISAWPSGKESTRPLGQDVEMAQMTEEILRAGEHTMQLGDVFARVSDRSGKRKPSVTDFLRMLKHARGFTVEFNVPERPTVRLRRLDIGHVAQAILLQSPCLLTTEEILSKARKQFGPEFAHWNARTLGNFFIGNEAIFLLGPRRYGLRQHFRIPAKLSTKVRNDVHVLLKREQRPLSASDIIGSYQFGWSGRANKYELAHILREDDRFVDLGRLLFGLAAWGLEERAFVKDLIEQILSENGRPMTSNELFQQVYRRRSISPHVVSRELQVQPGFQDYGFGFYGLKSWGDAARDTLATQALFVETAVRLSQGPLTFGRLCELLSVPSTGGIADKLWQTCCSVPSISRNPDQQSVTSRLRYTRAGSLS
jgi:hypothetical protein